MLLLELLLGNFLKRDTLKTHLEMTQRWPTAKAKGAGDSSADTLTKQQT